MTSKAWISGILPSQEILSGEISREEFPPNVDPVAVAAAAPVAVQPFPPATHQPPPSPPPPIAAAVPAPPAGDLAAAADLLSDLAFAGVRLRLECDPAGNLSLRALGPTEARAEHADRIRALKPALCLALAAQLATDPEAASGRHDAASGPPGHPDDPSQPFGPPFNCGPRSRPYRPWAEPRASDPAPSPTDPPWSIAWGDLDGLDRATADVERWRPDPEPREIGPPSPMLMIRAGPGDPWRVVPAARIPSDAREYHVEGTMSRTIPEHWRTWFRRHP